MINYIAQMCIGLGFSILVYMIGYANGRSDRGKFHD